MEYYPFGPRVAVNEVVYVAEQETLIGKSLAGYIVQAELGRGGMGVVYRAYERTLARTVALKVLPQHFATDTSFVKRFLREARAAAQLSHPNIVHVYAVGENKGYYFIAMEFVDGGSLKQLIEERGQLPTGDALRLFWQVLQGVGEAHAHGIIHRDIKPHNIMVDRAGRVKVMDFGLAKALQADTQLTGEGVTLGTPHYMAPEQILGEASDWRSDVYALGVTLFEMLAGQPPFSGETPTALAYQIVNTPFPPVTKFNDAVPPLVAHLVDRMTMKEPEKRCQSVAEALQLLNELRHASLAQPVVAAPAPVRVSSSRRKFLAIAGILAGAGMLGGGALAVRRRRMRTKRDGEQSPPPHRADMPAQSPVPPPENSGAPPSTPLDIMALCPANIGDKWQYRISGGPAPQGERTIEREVTLKEKGPDNLCWHEELRRIELEYCASRDTGFQLMSLVFITPREREQAEIAAPIQCFTATPEAYWKSAPAEVTLRGNRGNAVASVEYIGEYTSEAGTFPQCVKWEIEYTPLAPEPMRPRMPAPIGNMRVLMREWVAEGVGPVRREFLPDTPFAVIFDLVSAKVGGKVYGSPRP